MQSDATLRRFQHNQPDSLAKLLSKSDGGQALVVTEGVFSMDGDSAPLSALAEKAGRVGHGLWLMMHMAWACAVSKDAEPAINSA